MHSDEKPFECQECGRKFKVNELSTWHKLVHTGEKPYGCGQCGFRCQQSVDSTKHYKSPWHGYEESSRNIKPPFTCRNLYLLQKIVIFLSLKDFKVVIHKYFYFDLFYQMF